MKAHPHPIREANEAVEHALHLDGRRKLRIVALVDLVKAAIVLLIGFGLLNAGSHALESGGTSLLRLLDIDAGLLWSRKFLALLHAADGEKGLMLVAACAYAGLRLLEAWGLWRMRTWARWLGIVSAGMYVPFELYYMVRTPSSASVGVLTINLAVLWLLWPRHPLPPDTREASPA